MTLTPEQQEAHATKITASFVPYLMAADMPKIIAKWKQLVGDPTYEPEDLSENWPVNFGSHVEGFAIDWHERKTAQKLIRRQEVVVHPLYPYVSASLDAWREEDRSVIDCKTVNSYRPIDDVQAFYVPQLIIQRACANADRAALLIVHGGLEPKEYQVSWDADYEVLVWERIHWLWQCVQDLEPPADLPAAAAPVPAVKTYDMTGSNQFADGANRWLANKEAAGKFDKAAKDLKALVPADAKLTHGHGIQISRATNGNLSIREKK